MTMAIASLFTGRPVRGDVGMTGEVTLRGRVLPIGGVKMKVLAAHRAGLTTVILPKRNERDLEDVPEDVRSKMKFVLVERIDEALDAGLPDQGEARTGAGAHRVAGVRHEPACMAGYLLPVPAFGSCPEG